MDLLLITSIAALLDVAFTIVVVLKWQKDIIENDRLKEELAQLRKDKQP